MSIPPEQCFANFRWDDCGREPKPVMYYWKPGSRCEVGIWRGCLPNINMFRDEYECVSTCIFSMRAHADHFNMINEEEEPETELPTTEVDLNVTVETGNDTIVNGTDGLNNTEVEEGGGGKNDTGAKEDNTANETAAGTDGAAETTAAAS
ncbi:uncharacterized protein LOC124645752 [Helicoverpa zea]|uniref:uncharacterized protein LOC124645752 n=1 Tax=Helicoverpa zea TaxID=7113 RepID=UPI001F576892|nr:uncharacterized protein LOC124645752 [Helicoverpa zea]